MTNQVPKPSDVTQRRPRPHARWQCGYMHSGIACEEGPSDNGVCCQLKKTGKAVDCQHGCTQTCIGKGVCEVAKLQQTSMLPAYRELGPCLPRKTSWYSRQSLALNVAILVGGVLLLCMTLPERESTFVPGSLSKQHSQILGNKLVSERCSLCHPNSHSRGPSSITQDELCMNCHSSHLPDAARRAPHDLKFEQLQLISSRVGDSVNQPVSMNLSQPSEPTTCAACHVEHHGADRNLKAITDRRCQACHERQFASFADGHPAFDDYPYRTQRRIAFDHAAHESKYFGQKNESFDCSRCHVDPDKAGSVGSVFRTRGFEQACASCHAEPIRAASANGWVLLQLPSVLPSDVTDPKLGLSDWPTAAQFDYDGEVTLAMRLLMSSDAEAGAALKKLPASGRISEIDLATRPETTRLLARGFRRLIADVAVHGQQSWQDRLTAVAQHSLQRDLHKHELALVEEIAAGLPPDLFRHIQTVWFGEHSSLASKMRNASAAYRLISSPQLGGEDLLVDDEGPLLSNESADDLLSGNSQDSLLGEEPQNASNPENSGELLLGGALEQNDLLDEPQKRSVQPSLTKLRGAQHLTQGGWYLDEEILAIRYMPRGHGDRTLAAWAEFVTLLELGISAKPGQPPDQPWHNPSLSLQQVIPGGCNECHLIGNEIASPAATNWMSLQMPTTARMFTKFDHTPHLTLPKLSDCRYCHKIQEHDVGLQDILEASAQKFPDSERSKLVATRASMAEYCSNEFAPMQRTQCVVCHRSGGANDGCTQCHNYHVGSAGFEHSFGSGSR